MMTRIRAGKNIPLRRELAIISVEDKANEVRARFATPGKHVIYDKKLQEGQRYIALVDAGTPPSDLSEFPYLSREIGLTSPTPLELAHLWVGMNEAWTQISALIEEISLRGKAEIRAAKSQAELDEIVLVTVDQLDAIGTPEPAQLRRNG